MVTLFIICLYSGNLLEISQSHPRVFNVMSSHRSEYHKYEQNQSTAHASDLTSDKFWLFSAIVENSELAHIRLTSNNNNNNNNKIIINTLVVK